MVASDSYANLLVNEQRTRVLAFSLISTTLACMPTHTHAPSAWAYVSLLGPRLAPNPISGAQCVVASRFSSHPSALLPANSPACVEHQYIKISTDLWCYGSGGTKPCLNSITQPIGSPSRSERAESRVGSGITPNSTIDTFRATHSQCSTCRLQEQMQRTWPIQRGPAMASTGFLIENRGSRIESQKELRETRNNKRHRREATQTTCALSTW